MDYLSERQHYLTTAIEKPGSLSSSALLDSANFCDAVLLHVKDRAPGSFAKAQTLISVAATHSALQRSPTPLTLTGVACHLPALRQLIAALGDGDTHVSLAGAAAIAALCSVLDVSGTRYGAELALSLSLLDARSTSEPALGTAANALATLASAGAHCYARVGSQLLGAIRERLIGPPESQTHELTLCLLASVAGLASHTAAHGALAAWADTPMFEAISRHFVVLPRSLWGDRETGVAAWRKYEAAVPGSSDDLEAARVPTLFAPRFDTRTGAAYSDWVTEVAPVRERELRQRAALTAAATGAADAQQTTDGGGEGGGVLGVDSSVTAAAAESIAKGAHDDEALGVRMQLAALHASPEARDQTLQRRDAALLAAAQLSRVPQLGTRMAESEGFCTGLARLVETTVGITDAPVTAAATLSRIASAPGSARLLAVALEPNGLLGRLMSAAACNVVIAPDVNRVHAALVPFLDQHNRGQ